MDYKALKFTAETPYPEICVREVNYKYARWMLDNLGGVNSEMSAVSLYFYNNLLTSCEHQDIAFVFHKISVVEMHHLEIFGKLAMGLGEDPKLWTQYRNRKVYWSPSYNQYPMKLAPLMYHALNSEKDAIKKYESQLCNTDDENIADNLRRILLDEKIHVRIFEDIICDCHL